MQDRRLVGIDLGITSAAPCGVRPGDDAIVCHPKAVPTLDSLSVVEPAALAATPPGTRLEVMLEPIGPPWLPIAVFFGARGHSVYRVSSAKTADLRRVLHHHAKRNGIDADTLAGCGWSARSGCTRWRCRTRNATATTNPHPRMATPYVPRSRVAG